MVYKIKKTETVNDEMLAGILAGLKVTPGAFVMSVSQREELRRSRFFCGNLSGLSTQPTEAFGVPIIVG